MAELQETKFNTTDSNGIEIEEEEIEFKKLYNKDDIKNEQVVFEDEDFWPAEKANCYENYLHSFSEEKFSVIKVNDEVIARTSNNESCIGAESEIEHKNVKQTAGPESSVNEIYLVVDIDEENIEASYIRSDYTKTGYGMEYHCKFCSCSFNKKCLILNHAEAIHGIKIPFKCIECGYATCTKGELAFHIRTVHRKEKSFKCTECDSSFGKKGNLNKHVESVHRKEKPIKCTECCHVFYRKEHLTRHIKSVHRKEKTFKCAECDNAFARKEQLAMHIISIHSKQNSQSELPQH